MKAVRVASIDPALANFGMARLVLRLVDLKLGIERLTLIETEKRVNKVVRQNSDDLRRAQEITKAFHAEVAPCTVCFAEVPTGGQSARAVLSFGISIGILANCPIPLIQVQPFETKLATVGTKTASKEEMIEWAVGEFPNGPWLRNKAGKPLNKNEHLADAVAVAYAGIRTDQFLQLLAMWRSAARAA
jgi:Holliday junction resolvasome RuvABC endonuclease subunit